MALLRQRVLAVFCASVALVTLGACAKKDATDTTSAAVSTDGGNGPSAGTDNGATPIATDNGATPIATDNGATSTLKGKEGELKVGKNAVDTASLGIPVYPGATPSDAGSMAIADTAKGENSQVAMLETTDPFDKVYAFYKEQMPSGSEKMKVETGSSSMAEFQVGDTGAAEVKNVMISSSNGKVAIELLHATKKQ
jgi:hypothetical protein